MDRVVIIRSNPVEPDSRVEKEAYTLAKAGYDVLLLVWDRDRSEDYQDKKVIADRSITRIGIGAPATYGEGKKNLKAFLRFQYGIMKWLRKHRDEYDIIHACDFDTAFSTFLSTRFSSKKYIFDIFDYLGGDQNEPILMRLVEKMEALAVNSAQATIICTEKRKKQIAHCKPKNLTVIHNSPAQIPAQPMPVQSAGKTKIVYVGILQPGRFLPELIDVIQRRTDVELHIAGFGKLESYVNEAAGKTDNIFFYGKISYENTIFLESNCDIVTAIYDPSYSNHFYAAPNKFYEALYLGKPLIMVRNTGMSEVVERESVGVLIDFNKESLDDGISKLLAMKHEWPRIKERMQMLYQQEYSWAIMEKRLVGVYGRIGS